MEDKEFLHLLRQHTAARHTALEQINLSARLLSDFVTKNDYTNYLSSLYGFVAGFEQIVYPQLQNGMNDFATRYKTPLLAADLQGLGIDTAKLPIIEEEVLQSYYCNEAAAWGGMYVMEGSTLGGQFIYRHLQKKLDASLKDNSQYLLAYGEQTGAKWKDFLNAFCKATNNAGYSKATISSAEHTFLLLHDWMER